MKEYKVFGTYSDIQLESKINDLARQGYEICNFCHGGDDGFYYTVIMEREVINDSK